MGSGSGGGGGGGGGGSGGGGGGGGGAAGLGGGSFTAGGQFKANSAPVNEVAAHVRKCFQATDRAYLLQHFTSPLVRRVYEQLFVLSTHVIQNRSWDGLAKTVPATSGCLREWGQHVMSCPEAESADPQVQALTLICQEDFLTRAVGDAPERLTDDAGEDVVHHADRNVFARISNEFLGTFIWRLTELEVKGLTPEQQVQLREAAQDLADRTIAAFENSYRGKGQITYRDLFRVFQEQPDWILKELRR